MRIHAGTRRGIGVTGVEAQQLMLQRGAGAPIPEHHDGIAQVSLCKLVAWNSFLHPRQNGEHATGPDRLPRLDRTGRESPVPTELPPRTRGEV